MENVRQEGSAVLSSAHLGIGCCGLHGEAQPQNMRLPHRLPRRFCNTAIPTKLRRETKRGPRIGASQQSIYIGG